MPHRGFEPASAACRSDALSTEPHPHPERKRKLLDLVWNAAAVIPCEGVRVCSLCFPMPGIWAPEDTKCHFFFLSVSHRYMLFFTWWVFGDSLGV